MIPIGLSDEQMNHLQSVAREIPFKLREDFIASVFERLQSDGAVDVITMQQLSIAINRSIRWIGLR